MKTGPFQWQQWSRNRYDKRPMVRLGKTGYLTINKPAIEVLHLEGVKEVGILADVDGKRIAIAIAIPPSYRAFGRPVTYTKSGALRISLTGMLSQLGWNLTHIVATPAVTDSVTGFIVIDVAGAVNEVLR